MHTDPLTIVGAGGHARVVADALLASGSWTTNTICFADDRVALHGTELLGCRVVGAATAVIRSGASFHVAVGNADLRRRLQQDLRALGAIPVTVIHPRAVVSVHAQVAAGTFIAAGAIIGPMARIGEGVIVNHQAIIDHDCEIGDWTHIAPHATLGGAVRVGTAVLIGANATVLPGMSIGSGATIGAGSVVTRNVESDMVCRGVPARPVRGINRE